jgi:putative hydrolase of the HAD superfamily
MNTEPIKIVAFDADDTLWHSQLFFDETEKAFCCLLQAFADPETVSAALFETEMSNMQLYGYGAKASTLSMIETAVKISRGEVPAPVIAQVVALGKALIDMPVRLMDEVEETLHALSRKHKLVVVTKGDLLDQQRKLQRSGIAHYFDHVEIVADKTETEYARLIAHLHIAPAEFLMIGNSMRSDILPVLAIGGHAIYVPCELMWQHEVVADDIRHPNLKAVTGFGELVHLL